MFYANEELQRWLFNLLIPEDILVSFEIDNIKESEEVIKIELVEKGPTPGSINCQTSCTKWVRKSDFKAKVVIEALKERNTAGELSRKYEIHPVAKRQKNMHLICTYEN